MIDERGEISVHIIYQTKNNINGKIYIGAHKQREGFLPYEFDGYLGSGLILMNAVTKYGSMAFTRETIMVFDDESDAYLAERNIVNDEFVRRNDTYNMKIGGEGGRVLGIPSPMKGKKHSEQSKSKMSASSLLRFSTPESRERHRAMMRDRAPYTEWGGKIPDIIAKRHDLAQKKIKEKELKKYIREKEREDRRIERDHLAEERKARGHGLRGRSQSPELVKKRAEKLRGQKLSDDAILKRTASRRVSDGYRHKETTKLKMSIAKLGVPKTRAAVEKGKVTKRKKYEERYAEIKFDYGMNCNKLCEKYSLSRTSIFRAIKNNFVLPVKDMTFIFFHSVADHCDQQKCGAFPRGAQ